MKRHHQSVFPTARSRWRLLPASAFLTLVLVFIGYKAATVSFSWDESYSYLHHVVDRIFWPTDHGVMGANHHLLNVWAMIAAERLLGSEEWQLRSPNVLAFVVFGAAALWHAAEARNALLALFLAALLTLHPYMLDMFSLARGYGMGMGSMLLSLVVARNYIRGHRLRFLWAALTLAGLSAMSNLVWLNYLVVLPVAILALDLGRLREWKALRKVLLPMALITGLFLLILLPIAFRLREGGALYFGEDSLSAAVSSFADLVFYYVPDYSDPKQLFLSALAVVALLVVIALVLDVLMQKGLGSRSVLFPVLVLFLWGLSISVQHYVLGTPLPKHRTAIGSLPLLAFCATSALLAPGWGRWWPTVLALILIAPLAHLQSRAFTTSYFIEWRVSGELRTMLDLIGADVRVLQRAQPVHSVCVGYGCWMPLLYYKRTMELDGMVVSLMGDGPMHERSDHYIVEYDRLWTVDSTRWTERFSGPRTNTHLYRHTANFEPSRCTTLDTVFAVSKDSAPLGFPSHQGVNFAVQYVFDEHTAGDPIVLVNVPTQRACMEDWIGLRAEVKGVGGLVTQLDEPTPYGLALNTWGAIRMVLASTELIQPGDTLCLSLRPAKGSCGHFVGPISMSISNPMLLRAHGGP